MKNSIGAASALLAASALISGYVRLNPLYGGPDFNFRQQAKDAELGKRMRGNLDPKGSDAWAYSFRYKVPSKGSLFLNAKPSNPQAQLNIDVYKDGNKPIATTEKQPDKKLTVQDVDEGDYIVRVFESWRDGEETAFELTTVFKPAEPDELSEGRNTPGSARELAFDKSVEDTVDYS